MSCPCGNSWCSGCSYGSGYRAGYRSGYVTGYVDGATGVKPSYDLADLIERERIRRERMEREVSQQRVFRAALNALPFNFPMTLSCGCVGTCTGLCRRNEFKSSFIERTSSPSRRSESCLRCGGSGWDYDGYQGVPCRACH